MNKFFVRFAFPLLAAIGLLGCNKGYTAEEIENLRAQRGAAPVEQAVDIQLDADDFDSALLVSMFKDNKIPDGIPGIEPFINSPGNPINFVDLDKDQKIDYVKVVEEREGSEIVLEFVACKSTDPNLPENQVPVWTLRLGATPSGDYNLVGGYPDYVSNRTYVNYTVPRSHGLSFGEAYLLAHLLMPRPLYISPGWGGYAYRPYVSQSVRYSTRNTYRTQNRISSIPRSVNQPSSFRAGPQATKTSSRFSERAAAIQSRSSFGGGSGLSSFRSRSSSGSLNTSGFRGGSTTTRSTPNNTSRPSSTSRSSFGSSRGSSSSGRSSFGGGRSSFGGSRGGKR
jgi:hypothetical protein